MTQPRQNLEERRQSVIRTTAMERHAQTIIGSLILACLLGAGAVLLDLRDRMSRGEEKQISQIQLTSSLRDQVQSLGNDRYTSTDARREFAEVYKRLMVIEAEIDLAKRRAK